MSGLLHLVIRNLQIPAPGLTVAEAREKAVQPRKAQPAKSTEANTTENSETITSAEKPKRKSWFKAKKT